MSKKKTAARGKKAKAKDDESFVVLFDDEHADKPEDADDSSAKAEGDGSFVVMLDDPAAPDAGSAEKSDGSFVVMLDDEPQTASVVDSGDDDYFVVLLDDENSDQSSVSQPEEGVFKVVLPADFRMPKVVALKPELVSTLSARVVQYDASLVEQADTSSIQLIAAHLAALETAAASVEWVGASEAFLQTARILGFDYSSPEVEKEGGAEVESAAA